MVELIGRYDANFSATRDFSGPTTLPEDFGRTPFPLNPRHHRQLDDFTLSVRDEFTEKTIDFSYMLEDAGERILIGAPSSATQGTAGDLTS